VVLRHARGDTPAFRLKMTMADVATHPIYNTLNDFAADVLVRTNGAVEIKVFGAGQLSGQGNVLTGMQAGTVDLACHTTGFIETLYPSIGVLDLPYIFPTARAAEDVLDGAVGQQLFDQFPAKGIYGLAWGHWGWRPVTHVSRAVAEPKDIVGSKIRIQPGAIDAATYKTLGAAPALIDVAEIYLALSQRAVDALEVPLISIVARKFYEVAKNISLTNFSYNAGAIMMSKRSMDALPAEFQTAIRAAAVATSQPWRRLMAVKTEEAVAFLKTQGCLMTLVNKPAYVEALKPVFEQFRPVVGPELLDAILKQTASA
jgi:tripartite ATP-independent transporter DctP family solute receptor